MRRNTIIILIITITLLFVLNEYVLKKPVMPDESPQNADAPAAVEARKAVDVPEQQENAAEVKTLEASGEALIGGTFELTDQNGNVFTEKQMKGKTTLVYFGFTNCPMICPTTLSNISLGIEQLPAEMKDKVQVVFITVDPERDTQERLKTFLANFPAPIIGLTGSKADIEQAEKTYRVYAEKASSDNPDASENYDMNHSSIIYVMGEDGKFISNLTQESTPDQIAAEVKKVVKQ